MSGDRFVSFPGYEGVIVESPDGTVVVGEQLWRVAQDERCPASAPWAVVLDSTGEVIGCHASEAQAEARLAFLLTEQ